jgi:hypothetical protein
VECYKPCKPPRGLEFEATDIIGTPTPGECGEGKLAVMGRRDRLANWFPNWFILLFYYFKKTWAIIFKKGRQLYRLTVGSRYAVLERRDFK